MFTASFFLSSVFFYFIFFAACRFSQFYCLPTTSTVLIVFAYLQPTIHTKSTLPWGEDCSVLALQSTIFSPADWTTDERPMSHAIK